MKKVINWIAAFIFKHSGMERLTDYLDLEIYTYKKRLNMVPVSYKLFVLIIGMTIGGSGVFIHKEYPNIETKTGTIVIENTRPMIAEAKEAPKVEKEKSIEEKIAETFPENPALMIAVAKAESGLDNMATNRNKNGSRDIGLMMINSVHGYDDIEMFDVDKNLKAAREIYDKQGITAWAAFNNGSYKQFLK